MLKLLPSMASHPPPHFYFLICSFLKHSVEGDDDANGVVKEWKLRGGLAGLEDGLVLVMYMNAALGKEKTYWGD